MQEIINRLKSPVVLVQIIATVVGVVIFFLPGQTQAIQVVSAAVVALINLLSGLNNPTNPIGF